MFYTRKFNLRRYFFNRFTFCEETSMYDYINIYCLCAFGHGTFQFFCTYISAPVYSFISWSERLISRMILPTIGPRSTVQIRTCRCALCRVTCYIHSVRSSHKCSQNWLFSSFFDETIFLQPIQLCK